MGEVYIIDNKIKFNPDSHTLTPLTEQGDFVLLHAPTSRCLKLIIERRSTTIKQRVFFTEVWEKFDIDATQNTLYQNISLLRRGLKQAGINNDVIQTVPRKGFSLAAGVSIEIVSQPKMQTTIVNSVEKNKNNPHSTKVKSKHSCYERYKGNKFNANLIFITIALLTLIFYIYNHLADDIDAPFETYTHLKDKQGCRFFSKQKQNNNGYIKFIEQNNFDCRRNEYIYISTYKSHLGTLTLQCNKPMNRTTNIDRECFSVVYFGEKNEE